MSRDEKVSIDLLSNSRSLFIITVNVSTTHENRLMIGVAVVRETFDDTNIPLKGSMRVNGNIAFNFTRETLNQPDILFNKKTGVNRYETSFSRQKRIEERTSISSQSEARK